MDNERAIVGLESQGLGWGRLLGNCNRSIRLCLPRRLDIIDVLSASGIDAKRARITIMTINYNLLALGHVTRGKVRILVDSALLRMCNQ